jgi:glycosyltransferase involved in cell wall biosynthesis
MSGALHSAMQCAIAAPISRERRILMVTHYFESHRGGIELMAGRLARELGRAGRPIVWLASDSTPPPGDDDLGGSTVGVRALNLTERYFGIPYPLFGLGGMLRIWRAVRHADIVVAHDALYLTCAAALLFARWHRKPTLVVQHVGAVPYRNRLFRRLMQLANRMVARPLLAGADRIAFVSEITARHFSNLRLRTPPAVIFTGVDANVFRLAAPDEKASLRRQLALPVDRPVALFVGRFVEKKGLHILREMAAQRPDLHWAFAGQGPLDPRRWRSPNVTVFDGLSGASLAKLYQASDLFVLPSVGEGYPLVIQEALACGLPVVCREETAQADPAAQPLLTAVPILGDDTTATAAAFCTTADHGLQDDFAAATARARFARERYSWAACAERYLSLIDSISRQRRNKPRETTVSLVRPEDGVA